MTPDEWIEIVRRIQANWPQQTIPRVSLAKWYDDLKALPADTVAAAVESLYRQGREWPPNGAQILAEIADQTLDAPEFGAAWQMIHRAIQSYGSANHAKVVAALQAKHPAVAELAAQVNVRDIGLADAGDTTLHAQARERYTSIVRAHRRTLTHHGLPSASAPQLRVHQSAPRPIGDVMTELVAGLKPADTTEAA
jgi:hypothetical protein